MTTLLGHSAGASLVTRYAVEHPERISRLVLVTRSPWSVGIDMTIARRRRILEARKDEPWYPQVSAAFEAIQTGAGRDWDALKPAFYGFRSGVRRSLPECRAGRTARRRAPSVAG